MTGRDAEREQLAALLIALWEEDAGESLDGLDGVSEAIDAYLARLLPVVDRIANECAAAALRAAADEYETDGEIVSALADQARIQFDLASEAAYAITASDFRHIAGRLRNRADALTAGSKENR